MQSKFKIKSMNKNLREDSKMSWRGSKGGQNNNTSLMDWAGLFGLLVCIGGLIEPSFTIC